MGDVNYAPLIDDMVWSFSRIDSYSECPYRWYLKYIRKFKEKDLFYSSYGTFMHKLIEQYYNGELTKPEMLISFLKDFKSEVKGQRPMQTTVEKFINNSVQYLKDFEPFPYKKESVEERVGFEIGDKKFIGYIDFRGIDEADGGIVIIDNKSKELRPRSARRKPTLKDKELDEKLRQLYLYSVAVEQKYGRLPKALCFNCYRAGTFIYEEFDKKACEKAKEWALETISTIRDDTDFEPKPNPFVCKWICGVSDHCEYCAGNGKR